MFFRFVTKHACVGQTDGQTDRMTIYDLQDRASIAILRGKNEIRRGSSRSGLNLCWSGLLRLGGTVDSLLYDTCLRMTSHYFRTAGANRRCSSR